MTLLKIIQQKILYMDYLQYKIHGKFKLDHYFFWTGVKLLKKRLSFLNILTFGSEIDSIISFLLNVTP